jgi:hypothetical protein
MGITTDTFHASETRRTQRATPNLLMSLEIGLFWSSCSEFVIRNFYNAEI